MKRILLTGLSVTGKFTLTNALAKRGYKAVNADTDEWCEWVEVEADADAFGTSVEPNLDWVWREEHIQAFLSTEDADVLFLKQVARVLSLKQLVEPRLRAVADEEARWQI